MPRRQRPAPNPYFDTARAVASRRKPHGRVFWVAFGVIAAVVVLTGCYFLFTSEYFSITDPKVESNSDTITAKIKTAITTYSNHKQLGFFSSKNYWLLNEGGLSNFISDQIADIAELETLEVKKSYPNSLVVTASVYQPFVRIQSESASAEYVLDQKGIVTGTYEVVAPGESTDANTNTQTNASILPLVHDANNRIIQVGKQMASAQLVAAVDTIFHQQGQYALSFESFSIPEIHCPVLPAVIEDAENSNTNSATNSNANSNHNTNTSANSNKNTNTAPECDRSELILGTTQVNASLKDGPEVYFSLSYDLTEELDRLRIFVESKKAELNSIHYIDVRIPERIYYQ